MTLSELLVELNRLDIRLEVRGDQLAYFPRCAVTPRLAEVLKSHKPALMLLAQPTKPALDSLADATVVWQAAVDRLATETDWPAHLITALRSATPCWRDASESKYQAQASPNFLPPWAREECTEIGWPDPCKSCGSFELWEAIGGAWRCQHCDPPEASRRFLTAAERIRRRTLQSRQDVRREARADMIASRGDGST